MVRRRRLTDNEKDGRLQDGGGSSRWLLTYADMITLLMAFFILMYSMSVLNLSRFREVAVSIRGGFGGVTEGCGQSVLADSGHSGSKPTAIDDTGVPWQAMRDIERFVKEEHLEKSVKMRLDERGLIISLVTDKVIFRRGEADLSPATIRIIDRISDTLKSVPNRIQIEGHTCDLPIASRYPSNWELSTARASTVVRYMIEVKKIPPERLSASGYADSKPLVPNTNESNRASNRRVDIVLLKTESKAER